jgi:hypothetical protein
MKVILFIFIFIALAISTSAQTRSNETITRDIRSLGSSDSMTVHYDANSNVTTLKAIAENFADAETKRAGIRAMNFAAGAIYLGNSIDKPIDPLTFSFWAMSSKPRFGEKHGLAIVTSAGRMELGDSRYVARARDGMEYLNFSFTREQLAVIAQPGTTVELGAYTFTMTASQQKMIRDLLKVTTL